MGGGCEKKEREDKRKMVDEKERCEEEKSRMGRRSREKTEETRMASVWWGLGSVNSAEQAHVGRTACR